MKSYIRYFGVLLSLLLLSIVVTPSYAQAAPAPTTATATLGQPVTLSVVAQGTQPFTYQWQKNGVNISGATANALVIPAVALSDAATYTVLVANSAGSTVSNNGVLSVALVPPAGVTIVFTPGTTAPTNAAK